MLSSDAVFISLAKVIAVAGIGALGGGALTLSGWLWVGAEWKGQIDTRLIHIEKNIDEMKVDIKSLDTKFDKKFDLIMAEIRSLKK